MKKRTRRFMCAAFAVIMLSVLNINPIATIADAVASSELGARLGAFIENLKYVNSSAKPLTAKAWDLDSDAANIAAARDGIVTAVDTAKSEIIQTIEQQTIDIFTWPKGLNDIYDKLDEISKLISAQNHKYRVAHLISLNNTTTNSLWRPKFNEVSQVKDIATVNGQFANVYTGTWDLNRSSTYNSGTRGDDSVYTTRAREVLGYDCDIRVEGLIFTQTGDNTVLKEGATDANTHTSDPHAVLVKLYQQKMNKDTVLWIDAVTLLYKALGQEQISYQGFMHDDKTITPETSPVFQGLSNPVPNEDGTYNGYLYYMFLTRNNTVVSDLGTHGVSDGVPPTDWQGFNNYVYWTKAVNSGFIPADKDRNDSGISLANTPITFKDFYQLASRMMQAYGEPVMNDDEIKALLQVYGTHYPIQLGTDIADAWAYLACRGIFDFNPITEGKDSILYDVCNTDNITLDQLLTMCTRIKDKSARTDFKEINITLDLSDVMKENYYFPVKDLRMADSITSTKTYDYTARQFYDYHILKNDYTNVGDGVLVISTEPNDPDTIISRGVSIDTIQGKEYYHIRLPITYDKTVYIWSTKVEDFGTYPNQSTVANSGYIAIPASLPDGGFFGGSVASNDGAGRVVTEKDHQNYSDLGGTEGTGEYCDSARAGRKDVGAIEPTPDNTLLENISFFLDLWTTPMKAQAAGEQATHEREKAIDAAMEEWVRKNPEPQPGDFPNNAAYEGAHKNWQNKYDKARENILNQNNVQSKEDVIVDDSGTDNSGGPSRSGGGGGSGSGDNNQSLHTETSSVAEDQFNTIQFNDTEINPYLTQAQLEQGIYKNKDFTKNDHFIDVIGNNTININNAWIYYAVKEIGAKATRYTALSDAGYCQRILSEPNLSEGALFQTESMSDNEKIALAQYVYAIPSITDPAVSCAYQAVDPNETSEPPKKEVHAEVLDLLVLRKHYDEMLQDANNYITQMRSNKVTESTLTHPSSNWTWTVTSANTDGANNIVDNVANAVTNGNNLTAKESPINTTIFTSAIMNRSKQVLISWTDMVNNGFVTITKGMANNKPVPDDTGRYLFYAPETEGVIIVNDILKTIQVGTTVYDLSKTNVKHLVYHDNASENKEIYFDIRAVVGVSELDFAENKEAHMALEAEGSIGSGSYAIFTYTNTKLFEKRPVNLVGVEERTSVSDPIQANLLWNSNYDGTKLPVGENEFYWKTKAEEDETSVTRLKMASFVPTANWCVFLAEGTQSTDLVGRCYIWYPRQPFESGYIEVDETDITHIKELDNSWDDIKEGGICNRLSLTYSSADAIRAATDGINSSEGKTFSDLFKAVTGKTVEETMDPEQSQWYERMNCASAADLWRYGQGKYFMSPDYIMRAVDISLSNPATAYGNNCKSVNDYKTIESSYEQGYMYFLDKIGYVYNLPYDRNFTYEKYFNGEYLLPLAINYDNKTPIIYNYNVSFYGEYHDVNTGTDAAKTISMPYGAMFTSSPSSTTSPSGSSIDRSVLVNPLVNAKGDPLTNEGKECYSSSANNGKSPFDLGKFVPAPAGVYAYIGYNNVQRMKLSEVNRYIIDATRIYYGTTRLRYIQATGASANTKDIQFTFLSGLYPPITIDKNAMAQRVYQGKRDVFIIPPTNLYASDSAGSFDINVNDYGNTHPLLDWFSRIGLSDLLIAIDKGSSFLIIFVFRVLPIVGIILMTILVGLSFLGENKVVKAICEKTIDPVKILTFGRQTIETWKWQTVLLPCILMYILFAVFLNGNIIRIIMWFAELVGTVNNWALRV